jgi:hypothetical protein
MVAGADAIAHEKLATQPERDPDQRYAYSNCLQCQLYDHRSRPKTSPQPVRYLT